MPTISAAAGSFRAFSPWIEVVVVEKLPVILVQPSGMPTPSLFASKLPLGTNVPESGRALTPSLSPLEISPELVIAKASVPETEATSGFWSPVSLKIARALPVSAPVTVSFATPAVPEPSVKRSVVIISSPVPSIVKSPPELTVKPEYTDPSV